MLSLRKTLTAAFLIAACSFSKAAPLIYSEAISGDIVAAGSTSGTWVQFTFDVGSNVLAGNATYNYGLGTEGTVFSDFDSFKFTLPAGTVLTQVTFQYGDYSYSPQLLGFGMMHSLWAENHWLSSNMPLFYTAAYDNALTTVGVKDLFGPMSLGSGTFDWTHGLTMTAASFGDFIGATSTFDYTLTFNVEASTVPEPGTAAMLSIGLLALLTLRSRLWG